MNLFKFLNFYTSKAEAILKKENFKTYTEDEIKISSREVGAKVEMIDADGQLQPIADGTYEMEDGFVFIAKDGLIESIEGQEAPAEENKEMAEDAPTDNTEIIAMIQKIAETVDAIAGQVQALQSDVDALKGNTEQADEMQAIKENMGKMYEAIKVFAKIPATDSNIVKPNVVKDSKEAKRKEMFEIFKQMK